MQGTVCLSCRRPKAVLECEICTADLCKDCAQFLEAGTFSFLKNIPEELKHTHYCMSCYNEQVEPALETYNETMERARGVYFFFTTHKRPVQCLKKAKESIHV